MNNSQIQQLMQRMEEYIVKSKLYLEAEHYSELIELEQDAAALKADLQEMPVDKVQMFSAEITRFDRQLSEIRDAMITKRDEIRQQIGQLGNNSSAAKAYLKSSYNRDSH